MNSTSQEHQFQEGLLAQTHEKTHGVRPEPVLCQSKQAFLERRAPAKPALMAYLWFYKSINVEQGQYSIEVNIPQSESKPTLQQV